MGKVSWGKKGTRLINRSVCLGGRAEKPACGSPARDAWAAVVLETLYYSVAHQSPKFLEFFSFFFFIHFLRTINQPGVNTPTCCRSYLCARGTGIL
jgi:hypothetical protein